MNNWVSAAAMAVALAGSGVVYASELTRPKAGKVEILRLKDVKPGMHGTAWTVFSGSEPEPVPIEIIGIWKNAIGPRQDVILAKLAGAVALRLSVFSPDAICGITPIELMLEIQDFDTSRPADARTPDSIPSQRVASTEIPGELVARLVAAGAQGSLPQRVPAIVPIETPLVFSGFSEHTLGAFEPLFSQMGITAVQGGAGAGNLSAKPAPGWQHS